MINGVVNVAQSKQSTSVALPIRKGLLIDVDYAIFYDPSETRTVHKGHRTGTIPFMAREILRDGAKAKHRPTHDLESVFYVLLWICSNYSRPNNAIRNNPRQKHRPILSWVNTRASLEEISDTKAGHISSDAQFTTRILDYFAPYFEDLKVCSNELRCLFTASDTQDATHDAMLVILHRTLLNLQPEYELEGGEVHTTEDEMEDMGDMGDNDDKDKAGEGEDSDSSSGPDLNLRPTRLVICIPPPWAITTYPVDGARSSSPCPQYIPHPPQ